MKPHDDERSVSSIIVNSHIARKTALRRRLLENEVAVRVFGDLCTLFHKRLERGVCGVLVKLNAEFGPKLVG
jgi:hypothetical protein